MDMVLYPSYPFILVCAVVSFWFVGHQLGPPVVPFYPFLREGSPTKIDYRKKGTLMLTSLLEDLVKGKPSSFWRVPIFVRRFPLWGLREGVTAIQRSWTNSDPARQLNADECVLETEVTNKGALGLYRRSAHGASGGCRSGTSPIARDPNLSSKSSRNGWKMAGVRKERCVDKNGNGTNP